MERYSIISEKNPRELVLLRGSGCKWLKCRFCDYHLDSSSDEKSNFRLNSSVLSKVTGKYGKLEVINSGSFTELDSCTVDEIEKTAKIKNISTLCFESHWLYRSKLEDFRQRFNKNGIDVKFKIGIETFDEDFRENTLKKGMAGAYPKQIADAGFNEANLLFGLEGQTVFSMQNDIETGLKYFERICVNVMTQNSSELKPSEDVIGLFKEILYPKYKKNQRVDILLNNTDFGVG